MTGNPLRPLACAALLVLAAAAACKDGPKIEVPPAVSKEGVLHPDLPTPPGFTYTENLSDANPTGAFRVVRQALTGPNQRVEGASAFYKKTFPGQGWSLEGEDVKDLGVVRLAFVKKNERCRIEIKDETPASVLVVLRVTRKD
jgi:hypothetical protein